MEKNEVKKILLGWNGNNGFEPFEVYQPPSVSLDELKEFKEKEYEGTKYKFWIEEIPKDMSGFDYIRYLYKREED